LSCSVEHSRQCRASRYRDPRPRRIVSARYIPAFRQPARKSGGITRRSSHDIPGEGLMGTPKRHRGKGGGTPEKSSTSDLAARLFGYQGQKKCSAWSARDRLRRTKFYARSITEVVDAAHPQGKFTVVILTLLIATPSLSDSDEVDQTNLHGFRSSIRARERTPLPGDS